MALPSSRPLICWQPDSGGGQGAAALSGGSLQRILQLYTGAKRAVCALPRAGWRCRERGESHETRPASHQACGRIALEGLVSAAGWVGRGMHSGAILPH